MPFIEDLLLAELRKRATTMVNENPTFYRARYNTLSVEDATRRLCEDSCKELVNKLMSLLDNEYASKDDLRHAIHGRDI